MAEAEYLLLDVVLVEGRGEVVERVGEFDDHGVPRRDPDWLSDLFDDVESVMAGLNHFHHRRHDIIVFHVLDPAEMDFAFSRPTIFQGLEQMPKVTTDPRSLRKAYLREMERYLRTLKIGCQRIGIDYQQLRTDRPLDVALSSYLAMRMAKRR